MQSTLSQHAVPDDVQRNPELYAKLNEQLGYIKDDDVEPLTKINRMMMVMVICGNGRFICPIQCLTHFLTIIEEHSTLKAEKTGQQEVMCGDYVRNVSFPAN